ncbi:hypothetical protein ILYODFUR_003574 [Ilyodon furcidens]|uniref:Uncharacterized protein n=1 Tax=Ilyodon furcidens TaxID=33524 RepID=A0ABV0T6B8_9TELE
MSKCIFILIKLSNSVDNLRLFGKKISILETPRNFMKNLTLSKHVATPGRESPFKHKGIFHKTELSSECIKCERKFHSINCSNGSTNDLVQERNGANHKNTQIGIFFMGKKGEHRANGCNRCCKWLFSGERHS